MTEYEERALQIIDRLRDENKITIREMGCLRRAILENRKTDKRNSAKKGGEGMTEDFNCKCNTCKHREDTNIICPCFNCYDYSNYQEKDKERNSAK